VPSAPAIIGHESQLQALTLDFEKGNVAHAYLFVGRKHLGKFTVAKWFARQLLLAGVEEAAEQKRLEGQIDRLLHPDLLVIDLLWREGVCEDASLIAKASNIPQQHRVKAKAKTDTIGIDDIRALQERLHEVGTGQFRCCCIRSVERMQDEAVNALLKILEEPPEGVVFLLTAASTSLLLPTLVSRTRILRFFPLPPCTLQPLVARASDDDARFLLRLSQGAPGSLLHLRDDPDALRVERQRASQAAAFWDAPSFGRRLKLLEPLAERTEEADRFLLHLALALRTERGPHLPRRAEAFAELMSDLETNVSRPLLVQRFALAVGEEVSG
jgi:hypothetical protein